MNVERPIWTAWSGSDPVAASLRSIFQPPDRIPADLARLLEDMRGHAAPATVRQRADDQSGPG